MTSEILFLISLAWAGLNAFAGLIGPFQIIQAGTFILCCLLLFTFDPRSGWIWAQYKSGLLIAFHSFAALVSWSLCDEKQLTVLRYLLILPAFSIMLYAHLMKTKSQSSFLTGLVLAGVAYTFYSFFFIDFSQLLDPTYRIETPLGFPNGIAFITAMTTMSLICLFNEGKWKKRRLVIIVFIFIGVLVLLATKSRTATFALMISLGFKLYQKLKRSKNWKKITFILLFFFFTILFAVKLDTPYNILKNISSTFSLQDQYRGLSTGSNRYDIWAYTIEKVWLPNPLLGIGPGNYLATNKENEGFASIDNGWLMNLAEIGILGTLPLLLIIGFTLQALWKNPQLHDNWAASIFILGLVESLAENMFFSIGNPASLVFLLAVANITTYKREN